VSEESRKWKHWTNDEEEMLIFLYRAGKNLPQIGVRLGRSEQGCSKALYRLEEEGRVELFPRGKTYSFEKAASLLGLASRTAYAWKLKGFLRVVEYGPRKKNYWVEETELYRFIREEFARLSLPMMPEGPFKAYAETIRDRTRFTAALSAKEVANLKAISVRAVNAAVDEGRLKGYRMGRYRMVDRQAAYAWQPDYAKVEKLRAYHRRRLAAKKAA
jgi:hypothetical protein